MFAGSDIEPCRSEFAMPARSSRPRFRGDQPPDRWPDAPGKRGRGLDSGSRAGSSGGTGSEATLVELDPGDGPSTCCGIDLEVQAGERVARWAGTNGAGKSTAAGRCRLDRPGLPGRIRAPGDRASDPEPG